MTVGDGGTDFFVCVEFGVSVGLGVWLDVGLDLPANVKVENTNPAITKLSKK